MGAQQPGDPVESDHMVVVDLPQSAMSRLPTAWPSREPGRCEAVLDHVAPDASPSVRTAPERHPQISGRQAAQLAAEAARRSAVICDRHHSGEVLRDQAERPQRRIEAVTAAERDDARTVVLRPRGDHGQVFRSPCQFSLPKSRWRTVTGMPVCADRRLPTRSLIATDRCLPPVQPMPIIA